MSYSTALIIRISAIAQFLAVVVNPEVAGHRSLISAISKHWHAVLLEQFTDETVRFTYAYVVIHANSFADSVCHSLG